MPEIPKDILLVTPVWKDSTRLTGFGETLAAALAKSPLPIRWMIADDGSGPEEQTRLSELRNTFSRVFPHVELYFAAKHRGKGSVVREAWEQAPDAAWLAFVDADGAVTAEEMLRLIGLAVDSGKTVLGVRKRTETTSVVESPWRGLLHRGFLTAAHFLLDLQCEDPQCGAKVIHGGDYRRVAARLVEDGLAFDSELLAMLNRDGSEWLEVPVNWTEKKGGKVRPLRDGWGMLASLIQIRNRNW